MPPSPQQESAGLKFRPVREKHPIMRHWPTILTKIVCNVKIPGLSAVVCVKYGEAQVTTIVFMINSRKPPTGKIAEKIEQTKENLRSLLSSKDLQHVKIEFLPGTIVRGASSTGVLNEEVFNVSAMMGQSIANTSNSDTCGTLAGFFEIRYAQSSEWKTVALTCFHVVIPEDAKGQQRIIDHWNENGICPKGDQSPKDLLREWCTNGIRPDDVNRKMLKLDHPAQATMKDHREMITGKLDEIANTPGYQQAVKEYAQGLGDYRSRQDKAKYRVLKGEEEQYQAKLASYQDFVDNTGIDFGTVWAASGFRRGGPSDAPILSAADTPTLYNLDWALIEVHSHRIPQTFKTPDGKRLSASSPPASLRGVPPVQVPVCFYGLRTGDKGTGICHGLKCAASLAKVNDFDPQGEKPSLDFSTGTGKRASFSLKGDSGSLVLTDDSGNPRVVGLVYGGDEWARYTTIRHIDEIYADIKRITGVAEVRVKK